MPRALSPDPGQGRAALLGQAVTIAQRQSRRYGYDTNVVSDAMLGAYLAVERWEANKLDCSFGAFATMTINRLIWSGHRSRLGERGEKATVALGYDLPFVDHYPSDDDDRLAVLMLRLTPDELKVITLYLKGYQRAEISRQLGISAGAVSHHHSRAVARMRGDPPRQRPYRASTRLTNDGHQILSALMTCTTLTARERYVITRRYIDRASPNVIAREIGRSINAVDRARRRAIAKLAA